MTMTTNETDLANEWTEFDPAKSEGIDPTSLEMGVICQIVADLSVICWICDDKSIGAGVMVRDWRQTDECDIRPLCERHLGWELTKIQMDIELGHQGNGIYL